MKTRQALFGLFIYALDPILVSIRVEIVVCIENYTLQLNGLRNSLKKRKVAQQTAQHSKMNTTML